MTQDDKRKFNEKKEAIVSSFKVSLDKTSAYLKSGATQAERELLEADDAFQQRLSYFLIEEQEKLITTLKDLSGDDNKPETRLKATLELGKILWGEKFNPPPPTEPIVNITIPQRETKGEKEQHDNAASVLRILSQSGAIKSRIDKSTEGETH